MGIKFLLSITLLMQFTGLDAAAPKFEPDNPAGFDEILAANPRMAQIGTYLDPVTGILKRYYTDSVPRTWQDSKAYCRSLTMESASPLSNAETVYLTVTAQIPASCLYSWTSGKERPEWVWDMHTGIPVYDAPSWCHGPVEPQCAALHRLQNLDALDCTALHCSLCELKL